MSQEKTVKDIVAAIREVDEKYEEHEDYCSLQGILREEISYKYNYEKFDESKARDSDKAIFSYLKELEEKLGDQLTLISSERGEGSGDYDGYEWLLQLGDRYFMVYGYYSSWHGYDCDNYYDLNEVKPVEKTIIVYEPIK